MQIRQFRTMLLVLVATFLLSAGSAFAQDGKLKVHVSPPQAYVFVDGKAIREGSHPITLPAGQHAVTVVNYGYKMQTQNVSIEAKKTTNIDVKLEPYGDKVAGPWGRIEFKGPERDAVLLEGKTPEYFVGHVDEFNFTGSGTRNCSSRLAPITSPSPEMGPTFGPAASISPPTRKLSSS